MSKNIVYHKADADLVVPESASTIICSVPNTATRNIYLPERQPGQTITVKLLFDPTHPIRIVSNGTIDDDDGMYFMDSAFESVTFRCISDSAWIVVSRY